MAFGLSAGAVSLIGSVAGPVIGGMMGGDAAEQGAGQMMGGGQNAINTLREAQAKAEGYMSPYMKSGQQYNNLLARYMGTGVKGGRGSANYQQFYDANRASTIARGADPTDPNYEQNLELEIEAAMRGQQGGIDDPLYGSLLKQFDQTDLDNDLVFQNTYKTALDTGTNALNSRAANSGSWGSGAALKALTRFGAQTANTYTGDAYNRNTANKNQIYNFLSQGANQGQNAASGLAASGMAAAGQIGNTQMGMGNAQAAGTIGSANAMSGGLADATNAFQWNQLMSKPKTASSGGWGTGSLYGNQDLGSYL